MAPAQSHKNAREGCRGHGQTELKRKRGSRGGPTIVALLAGGAGLGNVGALVKVWKPCGTRAPQLRPPCRTLEGPQSQLKYRLKKYIAQ